MEVKIQSNRLEYSKGYQPPLFEPSPQNVAMFLVSNDDAYTKRKPFDFDIQNTDFSTYAKAITLDKVILPVLPNITRFNNKIRMLWNTTETSFYEIPAGIFYSVSDLCAVITSTINAGFVSDSIADTVSCSFNYLTNVFTINSVGGNDICFIECNFITYGKNCCNFQEEIAASSPTITSNKANLIFTRYFTVNSFAMVNNNASVIKSILSSRSIPAFDVVGVVDASSLYTVDDFNGGSSFKGAFRNCQTVRPSLINLVSDISPVNRIKQYMDFRLYDEYGNILSDSFEDDTIGVILIFSVYF
jgi:hypothetical protein